MRPLPKVDFMVRVVCCHFIKISFPDIVYKKLGVTVWRHCNDKNFCPLPCEICSRQFWRVHNTDGPNSCGYKIVSGMDFPCSKMSAARAFSTSSALAGSFSRECLASRCFCAKRSRSAKTAATSAFISSSLYFIASPRWIIHGLGHLDYCKE